MSTAQACWACPGLPPTSSTQHREGAWAQADLGSLAVPLMSCVTSGESHGASVSPSVKQGPSLGLHHWVRTSSRGSAARQGAATLLGQLVVPYPALPIERHHAKGERWRKKHVHCTSRRIWDFPTERGFRGCLELAQDNKHLFSAYCMPALC